MICWLIKCQDDDPQVLKLSSLKMGITKVKLTPVPQCALTKMVEMLP